MVRDDTDAAVRRVPSPRRSRGTAGAGKRKRSTDNGDEDDTQVPFDTAPFASGDTAASQDYRPRRSAKAPRCAGGAASSKRPRGPHSGAHARNVDTEAADMDGAPASSDAQSTDSDNDNINSTSDVAFTRIIEDIVDASDEITDYIHVYVTP